MIEEILFSPNPRIPEREKNPASLEAWLGLFPPRFRIKAKDVYIEVLSRYWEPHRTYHTMDHVQSCLELFQTLQQRCRDPQAVELALWLHDLIYIPGDPQNESESATEASRLLVPLGVPVFRLHRVASYIRNSKFYDEPLDYDHGLLLDIDRSVLAVPKGAYLAYVNRIEEEHRGFPEFNEKRVWFLNGMLLKDKIFNVLEPLEGQAQENLKEELRRRTF